MNKELIIRKALRLEFLTVDQGMFLFEQMPLGELMPCVNCTIRRTLFPGSSTGM